MMKGHEHDWTYTSDGKRICEDEGCDAVEVMTDAGDWVPAWDAREEAS